jgi:proteic killer suppression protein
MKLVACAATRYIMTVIVSFRHKGLEVLYRTGSVRGVTSVHAVRLARILAALDDASDPRDLDLPGLKLHALKGILKDHWSVWVNGNWRVTFRFIGTDVELVDYRDYH